MNPALPESLAGAESTLLVLPDGRVLARNVTPELAALLRAIDPDHDEIRRREIPAPPAPSVPPL